MEFYFILENDCDARYCDLNLDTHFAQQSSVHGYHSDYNAKIESY